MQVARWPSCVWATLALFVGSAPHVKSVLCFGGPFHSVDSGGSLCWTACLESEKINFHIVCGVFSLGMTPSYLD